MKIDGQVQSGRAYAACGIVQKIQRHMVQKIQNFQSSTYSTKMLYNINTTMPQSILPTHTFFEYDSEDDPDGSFSVYNDEIVRDTVETYIEELGDEKGNFDIAV